VAHALETLVRAADRGVVCCGVRPSRPRCSASRRSPSACVAANRTPPPIPAALIEKIAATELALEPR
jgi:hypothetical protein